MAPSENKKSKNDTIYDVLNSIIGKVKLKKFDYKCPTEQNQTYENFLVLKCIEGKILNYILKFNLMELKKNKKNNLITKLIIDNKLNYIELKLKLQNVDKILLIKTKNTLLQLYNKQIKKLYLDAKYIQKHQDRYLIANTKYLYDETSARKDNFYSYIKKHIDNILLKLIKDIEIEHICIKPFNVSEYGDKYLFFQECKDSKIELIDPAYLKNIKKLFKFMGQSQNSLVNLNKQHSELELDKEKLDKQINKLMTDNKIQKNEDNKKLKIKEPSRYTGTLYKGHGYDTDTDPVPPPKFYSV